MSSEIIAATLEYPVLVTQRQSPKVLVVDTDHHVVDYLRYFLGEAGYLTAYAAPGHDALTAAWRTKARLVIAEILTPGLDGFSLCRKLKHRTDGRGVRVILLSALAARERAFEAGADAFLMKPISESHLLRTVRGVLDPVHPVLRAPAGC
ncbi:MAG: response regulator transcription factor [Vicinamibacteria bacterium]